MDKLTPQQRHRNMAAIRSKDTKPEMIVRRGLWKRGFRYRLNDRRLPGHPDLVLRKYRTCVFVNGCFWHGHNVALPRMDNGKWIMENGKWEIDKGQRIIDKGQGIMDDGQGKSDKGLLKSENEQFLKGQASRWAERIIENSACCKIPRTNREFWVAKLRRNKERDREELRKLAAMGWHCITVWECELTPKRREETLESIAFTLNHIWLQDHCLRHHSQAFSKGEGEMVYPLFEEEDGGVLMAAEDGAEG